MKKWVVGLGCLGALAVMALIVFVSVAGTYNSLVSLDQSVLSQWAQVQNVYQRRADLVPNLVATVQGAAAFEKETFTEVAEARARVGQVSGEACRERPCRTPRPTPRPSSSSSRPSRDSRRLCLASWWWWSATRS